METFLGSLLLVPFNFTPRGWAPCNGAILSIQQNTALFSLLGTNFGGNGVSTFGLPKLDAPAENLHWIIATEGIYPPRD